MKSNKNLIDFINCLIDKINSERLPVLLSRMLELPADVLRLISSYILRHQRVLRMSCRRMRSVLAANKLQSIEFDITQLCRYGEIRLLELYPVSLITRINHAKENCKRNRFDQKKGLCLIAAKYNQLELLKWLRKREIPWTHHIPARAAKKQYFELLKWAIDNGCPAEYATYYYVASHNHSEMIKYLMAREPSSDNTRHAIFTGASAGGHLHLLQEFRRAGLLVGASLIDIAAGKCHFELVKWFHREGWQCDSVTSTCAAGSGSIEMMTWLREIGCPWDNNATERAANCGKLEMLQWLVANGCPLTQDAVDEAAIGGHIEVLNWLRNQGYQLTTEATKRATLSGKLACLQWLREQGCPWTEEVCTRATARKHFDILKWARANGCPWNRQECLDNVEVPEIREWIESQPD